MEHLARPIASDDNRLKSQHAAGDAGSLQIPDLLIPFGEARQIGEKDGQMPQACFKRLARRRTR